MLLTETVCIREAARRSPRRSPTGLPSRRSEGLELAREQGKAAREQTVNRTSKNYNLHEKKEKKKKSSCRDNQGPGRKSVKTTYLFYWFSLCCVLMGASSCARKRSTTEVTNPKGTPKERERRKMRKTKKIGSGKMFH